MSVKPGPLPNLPLTKIPGSAHDTNVKATVMDVQAHLCLLVANALHVVMKKLISVSIS